ncbi:hemerythrin domain-containing protein [Paucibacter sp. AS339]|uniref:hemerythrin domain-containing protein n=1 Tax=Paucibacter hankyongi TaxID=3133434 RepID=UPI0030B2F71C
MVSPTQITRKASLAANASLQPGSSYAQPFDLLEACHQRVQRSLDLLLRLCEHLRASGVDANARSAAQDLLRYFDVAAPLHHQDEELHVFPALERGQQAELLQACQMLRRQHEDIHRQWLALRGALAPLTAAADGALSEPECAELARLAQLFVTLHAEHLACEDGLVFPAAAAALDAQQLERMGREMAARRGLQLP